MTTIADTDRRHLARAIEIAEQGRGRVSPNPLVGAVIANGDGPIGEGYHRELGAAHAEVEAIRAAGDHDLAGATLYVSLEPCCHHGRTPPCTDAIRDAGILRVVVASDDPSQHASGRGLGILRDDGDRGGARQRRPGRPRAAAQPAVSQARAHRPAVDPLQVGDDARRQGRHPPRRLQVDLRRVQPRARPPLARRVRCGRRRCGHRAGRRPAAHRPDPGRHPAAAARRLRLARDGSRSTLSWCATRGRSL